MREGKKSWTKTWFWPEQIRDELPLTEMGTVEEGAALKRKVKMSVWGMLSLRCLFDSQCLELKVDVRVGCIHLVAIYMNMTFKALMERRSPRERM